MYTLLLLQFCAHLLADFHFQPQKWCDKKDSNLISKAHFYHILIVFLCSWAFSLTISFWWGALCITFAHFLLDILKGILFRKNKCRKQLFFIDQFLHFIIISFIVCLFSGCKTILFPVPISLNLIFILFALILCTKPSNVFIRKYIEASGIKIANNDKKDEEKDNSLLKAGRVIGSLERILSFVLILINQFAAVGFIIAAKTLLRFKDTDTAKTEYLLIGSFLSFGIAILLGIIYLVIFTSYII